MQTDQTGFPILQRNWWREFEDIQRSIAVYAYNQLSCSSKNKLHPASPPFGTDSPQQKKDQISYLWRKVMSWEWEVSGIQELTALWQLIWEVEVSENVREVNIYHIIDSWRLNMYKILLDKLT